jgi:hypothetical protein
MAEDSKERRRYERIKLVQPMVSTIGDVSAYIVEISVAGAGIVHQNPLPATPEMRLSFEWDGRPLKFMCTLVGTEQTERTTKYGTQILFFSGVEFVRDIGDSSSVLRQIVAHHVEKALDEQLSNARGVPVMTASSYQAGVKDKGYMRFVLSHEGKWSRTSTESAEQPSNGFTISAGESEEQIAMLCSSFAESDRDGRELIREMAKLSISASEGVPTRRYVP